MDHVCLSYFSATSIWNWNNFMVKGRKREKKWNNTNKQTPIFWDTQQLFFFYFSFIADYGERILLRYNQFQLIKQWSDEHKEKLIKQWSVQQEFWDMWLSIDLLERIFLFLSIALKVFIDVFAVLYFSGYTFYNVWYILFLHYLRVFYSLSNIANKFVNDFINQLKRCKDNIYEKSVNIFFFKSWFICRFFIILYKDYIIN